jgi:archaellum biogenesis ATPase FlaH
LSLSQRLETTILKTLTKSENYTRRVLPFIKDEYFHELSEKILFGEIFQFVEKYNNLPSSEALLIAVSDLKGITEEQVEQISGIVRNFTDDVPNEEWLVENTEKWCQEKAVYNAIMNSIQIMDGDTKEDKGSIPKILSDALSVSFDSNIGHDYLENVDERFDFYHRVEERTPFDLEYFNKITKGGLPRKSLNIALAGTGVGKSLFMCHCASANLTDGKNVLYITMEMAEEKIAERIDANMLNVQVDQLPELSKDMFNKKIDRLKNKTNGKLIVKEYPTASAHSGHFRHLLNELSLKKNFRPDIIYIDYLNICASSRIKGGANVNSYTYIKSIAEELRGLAVEFNVPIVSATQTTRSGYSNSDVGLEDTSESFGLPATADFMFALISTEELEELNQIMVKQLKNRYNDPNANKRFVVGIDRSKMRLYDCEQTAQDDIVDSGQDDDKPLFDKSGFGSRAKEDDSMKWMTKKAGRKNFSGINV